MPKKKKDASLDKFLARLSSAEGKSIAEATSSRIVSAERGEKLSSRTAEVSRWEHERELTSDDEARLDTLVSIIGKGNTDLVKGEELSQSEIDLLMQEEIVRRSTENIIKGRYNAIRRTILAHLTALKGGDEFAVGQVMSPSTGYYFDVSKTERGGSEDLNLLEAVVDADVWQMITDEVISREVNEDKLEVALNNGIITKEQFLAAFPPKTVSRNFTIRPIKGDEE